MISIINIWYAIIGLVSGVFITLWYLCYFSKYRLIKENTYYLKKDIIFNEKVIRLKELKKGEEDENK